MFSLFLIKHVVFINKSFSYSLYNNILIPQYTSIKYLGLTIDMNINFDSHISNIAYKILRTVGIISKIRYYLLKKAL